MVLEDEQVALMMQRDPARSKELLSSTTKVDVLTTLRFQAKKGGFDKPAECSICYEAFKNGEEVKALPCATASSSGCLHQSSMAHASRNGCARIRVALSAEENTTSLP
jgi:hypothetical protein